MVRDRFSLIAADQRARDGQRSEDVARPNGVRVVADFRQAQVERTARWDRAGVEEPVGCDDLLRLCRVVRPLDAFVLSERDRPVDPEGRDVDVDPAPAGRREHEREEGRVRGDEDEAGRASRQRVSLASNNSTR